MQVTEWRESGDPLDDEFPIYLTTGRVVSHYLSGTQTRRIGPLVDQYPEPRLEIHPSLGGIARRRRQATGSRSRRGASFVVLQASVVKTIRPDTVFMPYHWPGARSANLPDAPDDRSAQQDSRVQGVGLPAGAGSRAAGGGAGRVAARRDGMDAPRRSSG